MDAHIWGTKNQDVIASRPGLYMVEMAGLHRLEDRFQPILIPSP
jgi:hypothetical protein